MWGGLIITSVMSSLLSHLKGRKPLKIWKSRLFIILCLNALFWHYDGLMAFSCILLMETILKGTLFQDNWKVVVLLVDSIFGYHWLFKYYLTRISFRQNMKKKKTMWPGSSNLGLPSRHDWDIRNVSQGWRKILDALCFDKSFDEWRVWVVKYFILCKPSR